MDEQSRLEWLKFGVLVGIMLLAILTAWLVAPLLFDRITPAILGNTKSEPATVFFPSTTSDKETTPDEITPEPEPTVEMEIIIVEPAPAEETSAESIDGQGEVEEEAADQSGSQAPSGPQTHTIQSGEALIEIANRYDVPLASLAEVNQISNPNLIQVGDVLIIPATP